MHPIPMPAEAGCLSILVERGERPLPQTIVQWVHGHQVLGSIGTRKPDLWRHVIWGNGHAITADLKCDVIGHVPLYEELVLHVSRYPKMWRTIKATAKQAE